MVEGRVNPGSIIMRELQAQESRQVAGGTIPPGLRGYEGQPGNQGGGKHHGNNPQSANPEVPAGATPQPNP